MHTIDAHGELGALDLSAAQALAATGQGTGVVVSGYQGILKVTLNSGAGGAGATMDVKLQTGDESDGSDATDIDGATFTQVGNAAAFESIACDTRKCKTYLFEYHTIAGAGASYTCTIQAVGQQKYA